MKIKFLLFAAFISLVLIVSVIWFGVVQTDKSTSQKVELYVLAAASLTDVMKEAEQQFEAANPTIELVFSYASSGKLQTQIEQGTPADLFLSAGRKQMEALAHKNLVESSTLLLKNDIVLIRGKETSTVNDINDLTASHVTHLSIGQPETVPAGKYAKQTLQAKGLWTVLEPKIVYANDVRQVVGYVETGNVEAGFVYKTDISKDAEVEVAQTISPKWHLPIQYPAAILKITEDLVQAQLFFEWLQGKKAKQIFEHYGFQMY